MDMLLFGREVGGIITRICEAVAAKELAVGCRVFCMMKQAYYTYITTPTGFCTRIPDSLGCGKAAPTLIPYVTALHVLVNGLLWRF
ncbi:hypothetical protein GGTG_01159 [Gaeumannomyces tritici R3-111a-1]|uniref:Uncharacterized protein n=1 Tax=Gaeumannomyces tritici (strain R3-111a-1) TaxID=644352 RepID=J3NIS5_GAET3|nr:hypothetical protein GGTG_01159 [Gaeumannomyces tritici R3-111a-1]EJT81175.1 hypothetical protein GGTG_01159 [Gaeumannomyces tritici R3-111a-1]